MVEELRVRAGIDWRVATAGPADGKPVLLLHGFPECYKSWKRQFEPLGDAGYRVYAPDLPGFGQSEAPAQFALAHLAELTAQLCLELAPAGVHFVGHDWGGIIGHAVAHLYPDAVRSFAALSAPHPAVMTSAPRDPRQLVRSWYVGVFQIPFIEKVLGAGDAALAKRIFAGSTSGLDSPEAVRCGIAYYRANLNPLALRRLGVGRIGQPGLVVHATRDRYIGAPLMEATAGQFDDLANYLEVDCDHFLHRHCADEVNPLLLGFLDAVTV